jgi:O-antigen ligase
MGLLAPAVVAGGLSARPKAAKVGCWLLLAAVASVLFMSGGRATWVAAVVASIAVLLVRGGIGAAVEWARRWWVAGAVIVLVGIGTLVTTGVGGIVLHRLATFGTIEMRLATWDGALAAWTANPITGVGPGTFPFLLQPTGYFDASSFAPPHADNLYVQALAELGLLGLGSLAALATIVVRRWSRRPPPGSALWALVFAVVGGLAANPAALGYCAFLIVVWAGLATPYVPTDATRPARWMAVPLVAAAMVGVVPVTATTIAAVISDVARAAAGSSPTTALSNLELATTLDPTHPLYRRDRGSLLLSLGRPAEASEALARARSLNPWDDTTSRAVAITALALGNPADALEAAQRAVDIQSSEALNHATLAYVAGRTGDATTRDRALITMVTLTPWAAADPAWAHAYPGVAPADVLERAAGAVPSASLPGDIDQQWVAALGGRLSPREGTAAQRAFALILSCRNGEASDLLASALRTDGSGWAYWFARAVLARTGEEDVQSAVVPLTMLSAPVRQEGAPLSAPLPDQVAYARRALGDLGGPDLPSQDDGVRAWIADPARAVRVTRGSPCP